MINIRKYFPFEIRELDWAIAESETDEYTYQVRFRCFPSDFSMIDYPVRLNVFWKMGKPAQNGLASPVDIPLMQTFEDRIVRVSELRALSILAAVVTGRGEREFVFYARNAGDFLGCLNEIPQEEDRYPIEIHSSDDPTWDYFHSLVGIAPVSGS
jgi:hypothetical protein